MLTSSSKAKPGRKREGRQQGMVRKCPILGSSFRTRRENRFRNRPNSCPAAGLSAQASQKPTTQSKFTGKCSRTKCGRCHTYPVTKEKETQKNHRLVSLQAMDLKPRLKFAGFSATGVLAHLAHLESDYLNMDEDDELAYHDSLELEIGLGAVELL